MLGLGEQEPMRSSLTAIVCVILLAACVAPGPGEQPSPTPTPSGDDDVSADDDDSSGDDDSAVDDLACPEDWLLIAPPVGGSARLGQEANGFWHDLGGPQGGWSCDPSGQPARCQWADFIEIQDSAIPEPFCMPRYPFPGAGKPWVTRMSFALSTEQVRACLWPAAYAKYGVLPPTLSEFLWAVTGGADPTTGEPRNLAYPYGDVWNLGRDPGTYDEASNWLPGGEPVCTRDPDHHPDRSIGESPDCCNPLGLCDTATRGGMVALDRSHCEYEQAKRQYLWDNDGNPESSGTVDLRCDEIGDRYATHRIEEIFAAVTGAATHRSAGFGPPPTTGPSFSDASHFGVHFHDNDAAPFPGYFIDDTGVWLIVYPGRWTQEGIDALLTDMDRVAEEETWHVLWEDVALLPDVCSFLPEGEARDTQHEH